MKVREGERGRRGWTFALRKPTVGFHLQEIPWLMPHGAMLLLHYMHAHTLYALPDNYGANAYCNNSICKPMTYSASWWRGALNAFTTHFVNTDTPQHVSTIPYPRARKRNNWPKAFSCFLPPLLSYAVNIYDIAFYDVVSSPFLPRANLFKMVQNFTDVGPPKIKRIFVSFLIKKLIYTGWPCLYLGNEAI